MSSSTIRNRRDGSGTAEVEATRTMNRDTITAETTTADTNTTDITTEASDPDTTTTTTTTTTTKRKEPPPEKPAHILRRSLILASFWFVVLCLGVPIWWNTTTIYRANLPLDQMMDWANGKVNYIANLFSFAAR